MHQKNFVFKRLGTICHEIWRVTKISIVSKKESRFFFHFISKWPPQRSLTLWDDQWTEMLDCGLKQNPKCATSTDKKQNWIIFNRLSVIQNQHRRLVVGHPVYHLFNFLPEKAFEASCDINCYSDGKLLHNANILSMILFMFIM